MLRQKGNCLDSWKAIATTVIIWTSASECQQFRLLLDASSIYTSVPFSEVHEVPRSLYTISPFLVHIKRHGRFWKAETPSGVLSWPSGQLTRLDVKVRLSLPQQPGRVL